MDEIGDIVWRNDLVGFQKFLDSGVDINKKGRRGESLLSYIICLDRKEMLLPLIKAGVDVNDYRAIFFACKYKDWKIVKILQEAGMKIDLFPYMCGTQVTDEVIEILSRCAENFPESSQIDSCARYDELSSVLEILLQKNLEISDEALKNACEYNAQKNIMLLLRAGAKVTSNCILNATRVSDEIFDLLVERIDINKIHRDGSTILMCAMLRYDVKKLVLNLLRHNANVNIVANDGTTALYMACTYRKFDIAQILITAGADVTLSKSALLLCFRPDKLLYGRTSDKPSFKHNQIPIILSLIAAKIDVSVTDENGQTPLMLATQYGWTEVVNALTS